MDGFHLRQNHHGRQHPELHDSDRAVHDDDPHDRELAVYGVHRRLRADCHPDHDSVHLHATLLCGRCDFRISQRIRIYAEKAQKALLIERLLSFSVRSINMPSYVPQLTIAKP
ncbi:hypothetical protein SDC9_63517 [bioreactor metagenome]|uniref:Uncharacterized protein n=1 Tax=bioreactor metagenome TaxID=1076179 RepID=A0A644XLQ1_9ZZZZ